MTNWLAGGSCFAPNEAGLNVPLELSLAVHSDAGFSKDYSSIIGSLSICTTSANGGLLASGMSRFHSRTFADYLLNGTNRDIIRKYGNGTEDICMTGIMQRQDVQSSLLQL